MIVDTSAVVAIAMGEPDSAFYLEAIRAARPAKISSATFLETGIVTDRKLPASARYELDNMVNRGYLIVVPFTASQAQLAREAYRDFGKGSGHPAQLNFGDCFAYALAQETGEPLLYKGEEFAATGIRSVLPNP